MATAIAVTLLRGVLAERRTGVSIRPTESITFEGDRIAVGFSSFGQDLTDKVDDCEFDTSPARSSE